MNQPGTLIMTELNQMSLCPTGMVCEKGIQILLTIVGAFASFGLMTVAIGTDYWLYSRAMICNSTANVTQDDPHNKDKKDPGALTHSGLWRICCLEGQMLYCFHLSLSGFAALTCPCHAHKRTFTAAWTSFTKHWQ